MFVCSSRDQETELTNIQVPWDLELEGAVKLQNINIATVLGRAQGDECSIAHMNSHPGVPVGLGSLGIDSVSRLAVSASLLQTGLIALPNRLGGM